MALILFAVTALFDSVTRTKHSGIVIKTMLNIVYFEQHAVINRNLSTSAELEFISTAEINLACYRRLIMLSVSDKAVI